MKGHALTAINNTSLYRCDVSGREFNVLSNFYINVSNCIVLESRMNKRNSELANYAKL